MPSPANNDRNMARYYDYISVPQPELNNQTTVVYAAATVGGGSAVDHMVRIPIPNFLNSSRGGSRSTKIATNNIQWKYLESNE